MAMVKRLEGKVRRFDYAYQKKCVEARDYEALEMYVMQLLMTDTEHAGITFSER